MADDAEQLRLGGPVFKASGGRQPPGVFAPDVSSTHSRHYTDRDFQR
jgi:hypothetical protein